jgi:hypothetical protein
MFLDARFSIFMAQFTILLPTQENGIGTETASFRA